MHEIEKRLSKSSVHRYVITPTRYTSIFTRHRFRTFKMYACTVTRIDAESVVTRCGNTCVRRVYQDTSAHVRGVYVESTRAACITRPRQCSNVWMTRTFESPNRCVTYHAIFDFECWFYTARLPSDRSTW